VNKRLIVCCDGTWQKTDSFYPTNVAKLIQAIPVSSENMVFYGEGVGTGDLADRILGGALGWGLDKNIQDAYRFLSSNYSPNDQIYLFGFSRGAYTVRSLVGLIRAVGMLPRSGIRQIPEAYKAYQDAKGESSNRSDIKLRDIDQLRKFRQDLLRQYGDDYQEEVEITFLGCWDTVGALGIPDQIPWLPLDQILNRKYQFHNTQLSSKILHARHAVSIDENRKEFDFTDMKPSANDSDQVKQIWFPGGHGCVGGGTKANSPLSNAALLWMIEEVEALNLGLSFNLPKIEDGVHIDSSIFFSHDLAFPFTPHNRKIPHDRNIPASKILHPSVEQRWQTCPWYRPQPLESFASQLGESHNFNLTEPLAVGQTASFVVMAQKSENHTSVQIEEGGTYTICVSPTQVWQDAQISCTAAGWKITKVGDDNDWIIQAIETQEISAVLGKFYQLSKNLSRVPEAEWMELVIEIEDKKYLIGSNLSVEFIAKSSSELTAYANDAPGFYQNNQGWIFASITRTT
jgi:Uncharacterized alpha/beta hydrolase domain (DUF2235)